MIHNELFVHYDSIFIRIILNLIENEDSRLKPNLAVLYQNLYSLHGGVYLEKNQTTNNNTLFAVEFVGYKLYEKNLNEEISYVGVVATSIDYLDANGKVTDPTLGNGQYVEIYNSRNEDLIELINRLKNEVTVHQLVLEYIAGTFQETAKELHIL